MVAAGEETAAKVLTVGSIHHAWDSGCETPSSVRQVSSASSCEGPLRRRSSMCAALLLTGGWDLIMVDQRYVRLRSRGGLNLVGQAVEQRLGSVGLEVGGNAVLPQARTRMAAISCWPVWSCGQNRSARPWISPVGAGISTSEQNPSFRARSIEGLLRHGHLV